MVSLQEMLSDWVKDRPVIQKNNNLENLQMLLQAELDEFRESPDPTELADILIYALSIANLMEWDMDAEVREKVSLNILRFPASKFQSGDYKEARSECKSLEKPILEEFYT